MHDFDVGLQVGRHRLPTPSHTGQLPADEAAASGDEGQDLDNSTHHIRYTSRAPERPVARARVRAKVRFSVGVGFEVSYRVMVELGLG